MKEKEAGRPAGLPESPCRYKISLAYNISPSSWSNTSGWMQRCEFLERQWQKKICM